MWSLLLWTALPMLAAEPFTGTWKIDLPKSKMSTKPRKLELANGIYKCLTCDPPISIKADGTDQAVSGNPRFDTLSVRIIDDHTIESAAKKAGKAVFEEKDTFPADGMTITVQFTEHPPSSDKPVTGTVIVKRVGKPEPGRHALSGSWVEEKVDNVSENDLLGTFDETADGLKSSRPTGEHYDAKFDGKEYPFEGASGVNKVVLKRIGPQVIEETLKRVDGSVDATNRMTVSPDGRTMTMVIREHDGRINTLIFNKQ
jgi:hypothetical protein